MKIALLDCTHKTIGVHANTVPYGIGCLAMYANQQIQGLDIKLFKFADRLEETLKTWVPDLVGISQYTWSSQLNLYMARKIKEINPACKVIAGGPNLYDDFLKDHPFVDCCIKHDGEIAFVEAIKRIQDGYQLVDIQGERLPSLDVLGPMYSSGFFDEFLQAGCEPLLQTHRGCPFSCAFCFTGNKYHSNMIFLSPDIFRAEMDYLGEKLKGRHDVGFWLANTNLGTFSQDDEIIQILKETQDKYDFPRRITVNTGGNTKKLFDIMSIGIVPSVALQTTTETVLKNVNRRNVSLSEYVEFQKKAMKISLSLTELITPLPGETNSSFLKCLRSVANSGVQRIDVFTLVKLPGTPVASSEFQEKYQYVTKYRVLPEQFGIVDGKKIFEIEEIIVGTKDMSFEEYLQIRLFCFVISVFFNSLQLCPLRIFLLEHNIEPYKWLINIYARLHSYPGINSEYGNFAREARGELFDTKQELIDFYSDNFSELMSVKRGGNLMAKYNKEVLSKHYDEFVDLAFTEARRLCDNKDLGDLKKEALQQYMTL